MALPEDVSYVQTNEHNICFIIPISISVLYGRYLMDRIDFGALKMYVLLAGSRSMVLADEIK